MVVNINCNMEFIEMDNLNKIKEKLEYLKDRGITHFQIPTTGGPNFNIDDVINEINIFSNE